jgi:uncharacterized protein YndB with AHSA1/START domain
MIKQLFKYLNIIRPSNGVMSSKDERQTEEIVIEKKIVIDASPEVVFKAITDPKELTNWFPDHAIMEAKLGGKVKFSFYKDKGREHREFDFFPEGSIIEFIPNKKVSYTWHEPNTPDFPRTIVTWELEEIADNKTQVKLLHTGFEPSKLFKQHDEGWSYFLNRLQSYCKK